MTQLRLIAEITRRIEQDEVFREAPRAVELSLYRAAHSLRRLRSPWSAFFVACR